jgi:hypothetical protein
LPVAGSKEVGLYMSLAGTAERFQAPLVGRGVVSKDIEVAVVGAHFVKMVIRSVPLIENVRDNVLVILELKTNRPLVGLPPGVTLDVYPQRPARGAGYFLSAKAKT